MLALTQQQLLLPLLFQPSPMWEEDVSLGSGRCCSICKAPGVDTEDCSNCAFDEALPAATEAAATRLSAALLAAQDEAHRASRGRRCRLLRRHTSDPVHGAARLDLC